MIIYPRQTYSFLPGRNVCNPIIDTISDETDSEPAVRQLLAPDRSSDIRRPLTEPNFSRSSRRVIGLCLTSQLSATADSVPHDASRLGPPCGPTSIFGPGCRQCFHHHPEIVHFPTVSNPFGHAIRLLEASERQQQH